MSIHEALKKHQTYVDKLAAGQRKLVEEELQQIRRLANIEIVSGTSGDRLKSNLRQATKGFADKMTSSFVDVAEKESKYTANLLKRSMGVDVSPVDVRNKLLNENMRLNLASQEKSRRSLQATYSQFANRKADEIARIIRDGKTLGLSTTEIMKNVDERINGLHTTQARTLTHTSTLYTSNVAQRETLGQAFKKVVFTLGQSAEHTDICLGLEGKVFDVNDAPTPPLHWGCNSYLVPVKE